MYQRNNSCFILIFYNNVVLEMLLHIFICLHDHHFDDHEDMIDLEFANLCATTKTILK